MLRVLTTIIAFLAFAIAAQAQEFENPENIQIGLSTDRFSITSDFGGAELTIFGALESVDPLVSRQGRYDEIARSVLFLASPSEASYITGAALIIDGGLTLK